MAESPVPQETDENKIILWHARNARLVSARKARDAALAEYAEAMALIDRDFPSAVPVSVEAGTDEPKISTDGWEWGVREAVPWDDEIPDADVWHGSEANARRWQKTPRQGACTLTLIRRRKALPPGPVEVNPVDSQAGHSGTDEDAYLVAARTLVSNDSAAQLYVGSAHFRSAVDAALAWERARTADEGWSIAGPCADAMVISANSGSFRIACGNCGVDNIASQQDDELTVHELAAIIRAYQEVDDA